MKRISDEDMMGIDKMTDPKQMAREGIDRILTEMRYRIETEHDDFHYDAKQEALFQILSWKSPDGRYSIEIVDNMAPKPRLMSLTGAAALSDKVAYTLGAKDTEEQYAGWKKVVK